MRHDEQMDLEEDRENEGGFKAWLEDNLRIILSILVVLAIAGGIYSYSQRSEAPAISEETSSEEVTEPGATAEEAKPESENEVAPAPTTEETTPVKEEVKPTPVTETASAGESKETETSFIEAAGKGEGATHLARRALANYLEKNPDAALSAEHKIYIEDYLRKNVSYGKVQPGTSLEFSKSLIQDSIGKSKQLSDHQLSNLKKYTERVPSLR
ncbi:MAG: hypothetical protein IPL87_04230 [Candidatus Moraniibacteriota bacterium]|nr:MAG: hypothetical protein IPL87_04230 [Candidatus Moranbacteria bacterium]